MRRHTYNHLKPTRNDLIAFHFIRVWGLLPTSIADIIWGSRKNAENRIYALKKHGIIKHNRILTRDMKNRGYVLTKLGKTVFGIPLRKNLPKKLAKYKIQELHAELLFVNGWEREFVSIDSEKLVLKCRRLSDDFETVLTITTKFIRGKSDLRALAQALLPPPIEPLSNAQKAIVTKNKPISVPQPPPTPKTLPEHQILNSEPILSPEFTTTPTQKKSLLKRIFGS